MDIAPPSVHLMGSFVPVPHLFTRFNPAGLRLETVPKNYRAAHTGQVQRAPHGIDRGVMSRLRITLAQPAISIQRRRLSRPHKI
jgi:hypothetical protein